MSKVTDLKKHKQNKKIKTVLNDIEVILKVYTLSINALKNFSKYQSVMEVVSVLANNKTILEIQLKKYKKMLEGKDEG